MQTKSTIMKIIIKVIFSVFILLGSTTISAQGFQPPADGKAVVYFVRTTSVGGAISFEHFHGDKYIGAFKGKNYMRYECNPGEQLFWASSENKEFITADLVAGETYIVHVNILMGGWKAQVGLTPISINDTDSFEKTKKVILKKKPVVTSQSKIDEKNVKLETFINEKLDMYNSTWKNEKNYKHISAEMAIPQEVMK